MPHLRLRPRPEIQPVVDVDFITQEGWPIERVNMGQGLNFYGVFIGIDVAEGEAREGPDGVARWGTLVFLPNVNPQQIRETMRQRGGGEGEAARAEPPIFRDAPRPRR